MRYARFRVDGVDYSGTVEADDAVAPGLRKRLADVALLAPCLPSKIVCVGRNYAEHAGEMGKEVPKEPLLFFKPPSAVLDPNAAIIYPRQSARVDFEGELGVVIGRRCRNVSCAAALDYVLGFTIVNDVTARDLQASDGQWARAKGFDTFAPIGPWIVSDLDWRDVRISTRLNGDLKQDASTRSMIFDVPALIEFISAAFTLEPGDVIATGTPSGVGPMNPGDSVTVDIQGLGSLTNRVAAAQ
ncbi:MAG TPA: fumarylacetoacetate hydrolase family protein [Candidatus Eremiobacteraceae bacterium]|nr:fumarylacetoacetate hydrolase family protein [Candidatus Eremiobacteraceae bacterium]